MPTARKHPDKYALFYYEVMQQAVKNPVRLKLSNNAEAKKKRMYFYGARSALRNFREFNEALADYMNDLQFAVEDEYLVISYNN